MRCRRWIKVTEVTVRHATFKQRIALAAVPTLLVLVALLQAGRAVVYDQSSYAGFGFGMFATYENELSRWTEVTAVTLDGTSVTVRPDPHLDLIAQEVPTATNIGALALAALASDASYRAVHASVWTVALVDRPMRLERVLMVESTVERGS
jgi:hypothetical protein